VHEGTKVTILHRTRELFEGYSRLQAPEMHGRNAAEDNLASLTDHGGNTISSLWVSRAYLNVGICRAND
jgi:hypothetical protein